MRKRLTEAQRTQIQTLRDAGETIGSLANRFHVSTGTIQNVGKTTVARAAKARTAPNLRVKAPTFIQVGKGEQALLRTLFERGMVRAIQI